MAGSVKLYGDWAKVGAIVKTMQGKYESAVRQALLKEAHFLRGKMVERITQGTGFAPLSPLTLAIRKAKGGGGDKPLIQTGALRKGITVVQVGGGGLGGSVFVGIHRNTKGKGGKSMVNIASIHEFGASWSMQMTPRMRRFLHAVLKNAGPAARDPKTGKFTRGKFLGGAGSGTGTIAITIPARPFIRPVLDEYGKPSAVKRRFIDNVLKAMGGDFKLLSST